MPEQNGPMRASAISVQNFRVRHRTGRGYRIRLELVSQIGSVAPELNTAYDLVLPLNPDGHIDATSWADNPAACTVSRYQAGYPPAAGRLARSPHGRWYFDYATGHDADDHQGIRRGDESFRIGAFMAINEGDGHCRTFRVASMEPVGQ